MAVMKYSLILFFEIATSMIFHFSITQWRSQDFSMTGGGGRVCRDLEAHPSISEVIGILGADPEHWAIFAFYAYFGQNRHFIANNTSIKIV